MSCLLWLLFRFMEFFVKGKNNLKNISYRFFVIISFAWLESNYFNFLRSFQINLFSTNSTQIPLNRYEKAIPFMEFSVKGKKNLKNISYNFSSLFHLHCYSQVTSISYDHFRPLCFQQNLLKCLL